MFSVLETIIRHTFRKSAADRSAPAALPVEVVPGSRWRHLEIVSVLGQGAFGTVFQAMDTRLNRSVALKFLEGSAAVREGRILALLNEDGIVRVHSFEEHNGSFALCLELVSGRNLEQYCREQGKLDPAHAALLATRILRTLAALHRKSLLHRDLKPANVVMDGNGRLVLVDLGLGTSWSEAGAEIAGTLPYMAPEVLNGARASARSDLYAVGVMLFYFVTGRLPVVGQSLEDFRLAHASGNRLHLADLVSVPPAFARAVEMSLDADPSRRLRSAGEMIAQLEEVLSGKPRQGIPWKAAIAAAGILLGLLVILYRPAFFSGRPPPADLETTKLVPGPGLAHLPSLSADGRVLVYAWDGGNGNMNIWAMYPSELQSAQLTESKVHETQPAVSPDGTRVAFRSERYGGGIYVTPTLGHNERKLVPDGWNPRFSPDGTAIAYWTGLHGNERFATGMIYVIAASGGTPRRVAPDFADARYPQWSADGKSLLFEGRQQADDSEGWYVVPAGGSGRALPSNLTKRIQEAGITPYGSAPSFAGNSLYLAAYRGESSNLWWAPIGPDSGLDVGLIRQITSGPAIEGEPWAIANGTVVFADLISNVNIWETALGRAEPPKKITTSSFTVTSQPSVSRDGRLLAFVRKEGSERQVFFRDMKVGQEVRVSGGNSARPVVSPDGSKIAFSRREASAEAIWIYDRASGTSSEVCADCGMVLDWFPDLSGLVYSAGARPSLVSLDLRNSGKVVLLRSTADVLYDELHFSPNGALVALVRQSAAAHREIFVAPYRDRQIASEDEWVRVETGSPFDNDPRWTDDGKSLVFLSRRDSFGCIWQIRFNGDGKPISPPTVVQHLHQGSSSVDQLSDLSFQLAVGGNEVLYNLPELSSTIWSARPKHNAR